MIALRCTVRARVAVVAAVLYLAIQVAGQYMCSVSLEADSGGGD